MGDGSGGLRNGMRASQAKVAWAVMLVKRYYCVVLRSNDEDSTFERKCAIWSRFGTSGTTGLGTKGWSEFKEKTRPQKKRQWDSLDRSLGLRPVARDQKVKRAPTVGAELLLWK